MNKTIESDRLTLSLVARTDESFVRELVNTPGWLRYIGDRNIHSSEQCIAYIEKAINDQNIQFLVIRLKTTNHPIGIITIIQRDYLQFPDVGYALLPEHYGKGYAAEATLAAIQTQVKNAKTHFFHAIVLPDNETSLRLLKRLNFNFDREFEHDGEHLHLYTLDTSISQIDELTTQFFGLFTNKNDQTLQIEKIFSLCIPDALIIKCNEKNIETYNLESFISQRKIILTDGTLMEFEEKEESHSTSIFKSIAHRHSLFEKEGILNGTHFKETGNKLFQFVKTGEGWKISSVIWE